MSASNKILMVAPQPFYSNRGAPIAVFLRCKALAEMGYDVHLFTYPMGEDIQFEGLSVNRTCNPLSMSSVPSGPSFSKILLDFLLFFSVFFELWSNADDYQYVHCHEETALFSVPLHWFFDLPVLYDHHSSMKEITEGSPYGFPLFVTITGIIERLALRSVDCVVSMAPAYRNELLKHVRQENLFFTPLTAIEPFSDSAGQECIPGEVHHWLNNKQLTIVYTGSLEGYQLFDDFLEALAESKSKEKLQLLVVGGTEREIKRANSKVDELDIEDQVFFRGTVPNREVPAYLKLADILLSSRSDVKSTPLKLYTYLWAGKPILATRVDCHTVILPEDAAIWANPNKESLRETLDKLPSKDLSGYAERVQDLYQSKYNFEHFKQRLNPVLDRIKELSRTP